MGLKVKLLEKLKVDLKSKLELKNQKLDLKLKLVEKLKQKLDLKLEEKLKQKLDLKSKLELKKPKTKLKVKIGVKGKGKAKMGKYQTRLHKLGKIKQLKYGSTIKLNASCRKVMKKDLWTRIRFMNANYQKFIAVYNLVDKAIKTWADKESLEAAWKKFNLPYLTKVNAYVNMDTKKTTKTPAKTDKAKGKVTVKAKTPKVVGKNTTTPKAKVTVKAKTPKVVGKNTTTP